MINTTDLRLYIIEKFPSSFGTSFNVKMLDNIVDHMQDITHEDRIDYLVDMIPDITEEEIKSFLY